MDSYGEDFDSAIRTINAVSINRSDNITQVAATLSKNKDRTYTLDFVDWMITHKGSKKPLIFPLLSWTITSQDMESVTSSTDFPWHQAGFRERRYDLNECKCQTCTSIKCNFPNFPNLTNGPRIQRVDNGIYGDEMRMRECDFRLVPSTRPVPQRPRHSGLHQSPYGTPRRYGGYRRRRLQRRSQSGYIKRRLLREEACMRASSRDNS